MNKKNNILLIYIDHISVHERNFTKMEGILQKKVVLIYLWEIFFFNLMTILLWNSFKYLTMLMRESADRIWSQMNKCFFYLESNNILFDKMTFQYMVIKPLLSLHCMCKWIENIFYNFRNKCFFFINVTIF